MTWELIFSVDPCTDRTEQVLLALRDRDARVKMLRFSRRFGQPQATLAGMAHASGDALAAQAAASGLAVLPGSAFSADGSPGNYLRVPFTAPLETLSKAAAILKDARTMLP